MKIFVRLIIACIFLPAIVWALGVGDIDVQSKLYQPLVAKIPVTGINNKNIFSANEIKVTLASQTEYERLNLPIPAIKGQFNFKLNKDPGNNYYIYVTSTTPIQEPSIELLININWPSGQLSKRYTLLLDPSEYTVVTLPATAAATKLVRTQSTAKKNKMPVPPVKKPDLVVQTAPAKLSIERIQLEQANLAESNILATETQTDSAKKLATALAATLQALETAKQTNQLLQLQMQQLTKQNQQLQTMLTAANKRLQTLQSETGGHPMLSGIAGINNMSFNMLMWWILLILFLIVIIAYYYVNKPKKNLSAPQDSASPEDNEPPSSNNAIAVDNTAPAESKPSETIILRTSEDETHPAVEYTAAEIVVEAKTYMTYGRLAQAENILVAGVKTYPQDTTLWQLLLKIYAQTNNQQSLAATIAQIPANLMLPGSTLQKQIADLQPTLSVTPKNIVAEKTSALSSESSDSPDISSPQTSDTNEVSVQEFNVAAESSIPAESTSGQSPILEIEFDLSNLQPEETTAKSATPAASATQNDLEFDLTKDTDIAAVKPATPAANINDSPVKVQSDIHIEENQVQLGMSEIDSSGVNLSNMKIDITQLDNKETDLLAEDSNATKLDLARAYIDMGDILGAKEVLQSVIKTGNASQQAEAKALLTECSK